jgi:hypothetical protein
MPPTRAEPHWTAAVFGLAVEGSLPVAGLGGAGPAGVTPGPGPRVLVEPAERPALEAQRAAPGWQVLSEGPPGEIAERPGGGWMLRASAFGCFAVDPGAGRVRCAGDGPEWEAYLLGQVLPYVAGLRGIELLHAAAVVVDDGAVALIGPSGAGKSTLAGALRARGAGFLTDDVLAVSPELAAHAGPALPDAVPVAATAPLRAAVFLAVAEKVAVRRHAADDPAPLLGGAYDVLRRDRTRMRGHLEVCANVAAHVPLLALERPAGGDPAEAAGILLEAL